MHKYGIVSILILAALLTGCSLKGNIKQTGTQNSTTTVSSLDSIKEKQNSTGIKGTTSSDNKNANNTEKSNLPSKNPTPPKPSDAPQPAPAAKQSGAGLDYNVLNNLDNTKYGWGLTLNKEHRTPEIPANIKKLLERNGGIFVGDTSSKKVYLTFDEGYENGYTSMILDTLKANNVKATFFITGPYLDKQNTLIQRMINEGHEVGNHTVNHPSLPTVTNDTLENEICVLDKSFKEKYGKSFRYLRPPMGEFSEKTLAAAQQLGYKTIFWSFAYADWDTANQKGAQHAHDMVMQYIHNGAVILLHAVSKDNAEALDSIIKDIRAQGYEISALDL